MPIPKCKKPTQSAHYRPITLLSPIGKIIEGFVLQFWFKPWFKVDNVLADQFAFVPTYGRGATVALTLLVGLILRRLDNHQPVALLAVDLLIQCHTIYASRVLLMPVYQLTVCCGFRII